VADEKTDDSIVDIARKRYQRAHDALSSARALALEDTKFVLGDSTNQWQWPENVYQTRAEQQGKPCLTINVTAQHCNQVINQIRQNRPAGKVLPVDSVADPATANILEGLIRSIQSYSKADTAHDIAAEHAIYGGEGYWRVITEYESDDSFDQVITIKGIQNPRLVYIDPDAVEPDRSDAKWGFVFEDLSKAEAQEEYPDLNVSDWAEDGDRGWVKKDMVRRAEYFWCENVDDTLYQLADGGTISKSKADDLSVTLSKQFATFPDGRVVEIINKRGLKRRQWYWCKLVGGSTEPVDKREWVGNYLPIITVVGKEVNVNGEIVRKGLVRDLKDPARMVNYSYSAAVESLALQNKVPYMAAAEAIEGYGDIWAAANLENRAYLPYNAYDENGNALPPPARQAAPTMATAQVQMLQLSTEEMRAASGQQSANFGIKSEAASGVGIQRLKVQGEVATFHFPDNLARALNYEMRVLIDLIPKIYDTRRIVRILGLDGKEQRAIIDPEMKEAYQEVPEDKDVAGIFNPLMGRYDVQISTGPSYQTQRQEAQDALTQICQTNPQLMQIAGDIVMRSYDFPLAEQMAERLEKALPPELRDHDENAEQPIPPQVQQHMDQLTQQVQGLSKALEGAAAHAEKLEEEAKEREAEINIKAYDAITKRLQVMGSVITPDQVVGLVQETVAAAIAQPAPPAEPLEMEPDDGPAPPADDHFEESPPSAGFFTPEQQPSAMPTPTDAQSGLTPMGQPSEGNENV